ncbi:SGNH/GDSL hydrolase family protein [Sediminicoccus sp. KRV36]|uniref:SGNH/GDSL hydrolase family protein n=1 Tax=Sediminicoccus sp. KRV36 TaxID=3133721 RepID=UPI00201076AD|nr:SGNH/GDSL hydrolase family protein [Sediminicoccus rosea]UPY38552.1 SGNH/GDSL hydrolase family protein [Sediminicoccus rosea]
MRMPFLRSILLLGLLAGPLPAHALSCDVPPEMAGAVRPLPAVARALQAGVLRILVLGSGSITGPGASGPDATWPARLESLLAAAHPGLRVELTVRGGRGVTVHDHLALLREGLNVGMPNLVVWQAGTVEAVRGLDPDDMGEAMLQGLDRIRRRGADMIVMDQQFSRFLRANTNIEPYRDKLRLVAAAAGAPLFQRYDLMQYWVEASALDLERAPRAERGAMTDRLNDCLARALGDLIAQGVAEAR